MPHGLRVFFPGSRPLLFERPSLVLRAQTAAQALEALATAQRAIDSGRYCAGYLSYELGSVFRGTPPRAQRALPLLLLGIYDAPQPAQPQRSGGYRLGPMHPRVPRHAYDRALERIARAIYDGDVYQVNYTVPADFAFSGDALALFYDLYESARAGHAAYVDDDAHAVVSLSPELFLETSPHGVRTKPMKGTAPPDRPALLQSAKNRAEHVMIVDLLRNDLHRICSRVGVSALYEIERYPTLATMTSTIEGTLRAPVSLRDTLAATFPCGSITGAPKRAAMELIEQLERRPRDAYTGSVGYAGPQGGNWNVAIRTLQIDLAQGRGRLDTGGGIVADSNAADEWNELELKRAFAEPFSTPFALLETFRAGSAAVADHLARLTRSAQHFGIPFDSAALHARLDAIAAGTLVRIRVDGGAHAHIALEDAPAATEPVRLCVAAERTNSKDPFLRHKTSWRDAYDRALAAADAAGCFDAIFFNERGEVTEGARSTIVADIGGTLFTPPLECGVLPGILRAALLREGRVQERVLFERDLYAARALYAGNSARGLLRAEPMKAMSGV